MSVQSQEFNIFVIIEQEEKLVEEALYDEATDKLLKIKKVKKKEMKKKKKKIKPLIKKKTKTKQEKKTAVKKKKCRSPVWRVLKNEDLNDHSTEWKHSFSDLSALSESLSSSDSLKPSYVYCMRKQHALNEEDIEWIAQYD